MLQDQLVFQVDFILVQKDFCGPFVRKNVFSARVVADAFLDHIRYSRSEVSF